MALAAERVSRGERIEPLSITGPSEAREVPTAFNLMQDKLTRFIDHRTQLLAAISHDFRTPITSLRLRVEMVEDDALRVLMTRTLDGMRQMAEQTLRFAQDDAQSEGMQDIDLPRAHGGEVVLFNLPEGGLRAIIKLPGESAPAGH